MTDVYASLLQKKFPWDRWEQLILTEGVSLDRPKYTPHPRYPSIIYPMDYGFICNTISSDRAEVDVFVGSGENCLVGMIVTDDYRQGDREIKLLWRCLPSEIYLAHGFINFDRSKLKGRLILRFPMETLWEAQLRMMEHSENLP
ncbi:MAG: hypothetical protein OXE92_02210 [Bacteroidetes bacterium]|nr:hypothetical protein [Bacteroidota bacterium]MCY4204522.1 hypothetical protein [Bacteroidota bacterium]